MDEGAQILDSVVGLLAALALLLFDHLADCILALSESAAKRKDKLLEIVEVLAEHLHFTHDGLDLRRLDFSLTQLIEWLDVVHEFVLELH